jgi:septal ring factor EnvC (AmiA/AmiB activator)
VRPAGLALGLGLALVLGTVGPGWAQKPAEVGEKERSLQQKQRQLKEEKARAAEARKREAGILAEIETLDKRLGDKRRQVATLDGRIRKSERELGDLQGEIGRLESRRTGQEEALGRRLRALYRIQSQGGALPLILSGQDPLTQAVQLRHLTTMTAVDARAIREYRVTSEGLADRRAKVDVARKELALLRNEADQERAAADQDASRRRVLLAKVRDERAYHDRMVGELSEATRRMEAFLRELQARQRRVVKATPTTPERSKPSPGDPTAGLGSLKGRLVWPADGKVVGEFGPQVHPKFGTRTFRSGIEIDVPEGTSIGAVHPGHVVFTGWFRGYGNLIIVDHGGESYTLYGHAAEIRVSEGDDVRQGQSLGTVGDTGSPSGARLYFEVRHMGKAVDPLGWLRPRG